MRRACGSLLHAAEARAFGMWRGAFADAQKDESAVAAAVARWRKQGLLRCFVHWREQAAKDKQDEHRAIQLLSRLTRKKEVQALMSWREVAATQKQESMTMRRTCATMLHAAEASAFAVWQDYTDEASAHERAIGVALQHWILAGCAARLSRWREVASASLKQVAAVRRVHAALHRARSLPCEAAPTSGIDEARSLLYLKYILHLGVISLKPRNLRIEISRHATLHHRRRLLLHHHRAAGTSR